MFNFFCKKCFQGGLKHNFEPRFTEHFVNNNIGQFKFKSEDVGAYIDILEQHRRMKIEQRYVYDICTWCGKIAQPAKENED